MTYEKTDSFTGSRTIRISKPIVADVLYPPDYFLKKAVAGIKRVGDKIGDTKVATKIRESKAYQNVAKPILKVAVPVAAAVGLGAIAAPLVGKGIKAIQTKRAANALPKADIVSSVTGAKGTPVIKPLSGAPLRESLLKASDRVPVGLRKAVISKGQQLVDTGKGKLTDLQERFSESLTSAETLPKTAEVKRAEELILAPTEEGQMPTLSAGGFSLSPVMIVGVLLVVVAIGFFYKKQ